jgi:hypothetical protein
VPVVMPWSLAWSLRVSESKLHHTVPQFYLDRFTRDGKVEVVDRNDLSKFFPATPKNAVAETRFYSVPTAGGHDNSIETFFANHVEDPARSAFKRVFDDGYSLEAPGRKAPLALFLAFQYVRGPLTRRTLVQHYQVTAEALQAFAGPEGIRKREQKTGIPITDENRSALAAYLSRLGDPDVVAKQAKVRHLDMLTEQAFNLVPFFDGRTWCLYEFGAPLLLTSDEPVALVGRNFREPGGPAGIANALQIVFPVDPTRALILARPDLGVVPGRYSGDAEQARVINHHVAFNGYRHIVRIPGTNPLQGMTLEKQAPAAFQVGDIVGYQARVSEKARAKLVEKVARGEIRFARKPKP